MEAKLAGRVIVLPESRELDLMARMVEERGARTHRCPLISIHDHPDQAAVEAWIRRFIGAEMDLVILFTGEGVYRLLAAAERHGLHDDFVTQLGRTPTLTRGPKPARGLRELGITPAHSAEQPTTSGVIATLEQMDLYGCQVGVQLYGTEPNKPLMDFLEEVGAVADPVAPYVYASDSETREVEDLVRRLGGGELDAIAFTSRSQVRRLFDIAHRMEAEEELQRALRGMSVAAVGPIVSRELEERGVRVDILPEESYFMKPLVRAMESHLGAG
ncbi:uroporphyrinogen-III synthase [Thiohalorhabdus methylotrophus]|uniref:Uroporphyrinogen-III synthase n=1 Tax=Thiohalorhabdus methylotrophus TaxID=3242694 RepID=A0ABV4TTS0_9GAMM